ncbi:hypothetical protein [Bacteroides finegoldii]|uniref:hypothetical protein n=1 Tax=Bacteroides finegoldii TaxID=338188 RepID=UPI0018A101E9|nr:hypothetical protein [Bacteroides finegoldii]
METMKKYIIIFPFMVVTFLFVSCGSLPKPYSSTYILDYSDFTKNGIFVTEAPTVNFDYTPMGSLVSKSEGGYVNTTYKEPSIGDCFTDMIKKIKSSGANGVIGLKIIFDSFKDKPYRLSSIYVTGMVIKSVNTVPIAEIKKDNKEYLCAIEGIGCYVIDRQSNGVKIQTEKLLNEEQIRAFYKRHSFGGKMLQFFLGSEREAYYGISDGFIIDYSTNSFIKL